MPNHEALRAVHLMSVVPARLRSSWSTLTSHLRPTSVREEYSHLHSKVEFYQRTHKLHPSIHPSTSLQENRAAFNTIALSISVGQASTYPWRMIFISGMQIARGNVESAVPGVPHVPQSNLSHTVLKISIHIYRWQIFKDSTYWGEKHGVMGLFFHACNVMLQAYSFLSSLVQENDEKGPQAYID